MCDFPMPTRSEPPSQGPSKPLVKVKRKGQMTLPRTLREQFGLHEGDYLKAEAVPDGILLKPVTIADRSILPEHMPIDHRVEERQKP
jgi:AbrB family looped-hinge helix DNA binding protein